MVQDSAIAQTNKKSYMVYRILPIYWPWMTPNADVKDTQLTYANLCWNLIDDYNFDSWLLTFNFILILHEVSCPESTIRWRYVTFGYLIYWLVLASPFSLALRHMHFTIFSWWDNNNRQRHKFIAFGRRTDPRSKFILLFLFCLSLFIDVLRQNFRIHDWAKNITN